ncbi:DUF58 domain-containing protein [Bacterioplanes sanyensis]|uniref:DUF58 domain-containing protein n=1 Tax=Bacterioplanes sanyensis TaxID=1249553 RepID=A0A222FLG9_9GAMM|nr:DUF58 domain-containing protein [Bacterioplanes sanyensis]ASP39609.1 DUF58 domain-containing protein [Bacterioplanes sanyensis]
MSRIEFSRGAHIDRDNLIALQALAAQLPLKRQRKVLNDKAGTHTSAMRGRGIDFAEVREYQPGDDIRAMDWRVTARTGEAHIKLFREERERPVMLACDLRAHMRFGTRRAFKHVLAADLTALLGWAALRNGDRIGGLLFDDSSETDLRSRNGSRQVLNLVHQLATWPAPASDTLKRQDRLAQMLRHLQRICRPGSAVYIISDWHGFDAAGEQALFQLSRHCDVSAVHLFDALEAELPPPGHYTLSDGQQRLNLATHSRAARLSHQQAFEQHRDNLQQALVKLEIPLLSIATDDDVLSRLYQGLGMAWEKRA